MPNGFHFSHLTDSMTIDIPSFRSIASAVRFCNMHDAWQFSGALPTEKWHSGRRFSCVLKETKCWREYKLQRIWPMGNNSQMLKFGSAFDFST